MKKAATKKVSEKKTKETYASKASMMKHEKGESKKMKMKEGELPMMKKGGMKMYADGGKKKPTYSSRETNFKFKDAGGREAVHNRVRAYKASKSGKLVSTTKDNYVGDRWEDRNKTTVMDTTGYAKGKKSFPVKQYKVTTDLNGKREDIKDSKSWKVDRKDVPKTIKQMKEGSGMLKKESSFKNGGTKKPAHRGFHAVQKEIAAKQGISMEAAGAILASSARKASPAAKAKNPRLKKVLGKSKK